MKIPIINIKININVNNISIGACEQNVSTMAKMIFWRVILPIIISKPVVYLEGKVYRLKLLTIIC